MFLLNNNVKGFEENYPYTDRPERSDQKSS